MPARPLKDWITDLPSSPGVYLFCRGDSDKAPVYIGKSIHIKKRALDHWYRSSSEHKEKRIIESAQSVHCIRTAGDIGAQLLEASLIKKHRPIFNRRLRKYRQVCTIRLQEGAQGYPRVCFSQQPPLHQIDDAGAYGFFRSPREATQLIRTLAAKHSLCLKTLGIEKISSPCFNYHLKKCYGACINEESATEHNQRLKDALQLYRHQLWPYEGPIALIEGEGTDCQQAHILWQWHYIQSVDYDQIHSGIQNVTLTPSAQIDIDHYKILNRCLEHPPANIRILEIQQPSLAT